MRSTRARRRWWWTARASSRSSSRCRLPTTARRRSWPPRLPGAGPGRRGLRAARPRRLEPVLDQRADRSAAPAARRGPGRRPARLGLARGRPGNPPPSAPSPKHQLLDAIVNGLKDHPALGALEGHRRAPQPVPRATPGSGRPACSPRAAADPPDRRQAPDGRDPGAARRPSPTWCPTGPRSTSRARTSIRSRIPPACTPAPPTRTSASSGTSRTRWPPPRAARPLWMTLQIAWSGVVPSPEHPGTVPRWPSLFPRSASWSTRRSSTGRAASSSSAAIASRSRAPWTRRRAGTGRSSKPCSVRSLRELTSTAVQPALLAPDRRVKITPSTQDIELITRQQGSFLYLIAVRRGGATTQVTFSGVPRKANGSADHVGRGALRIRPGSAAPAARSRREVAFRTVGVAARQVPRLVRAARRARLPLPALAASAAWGGVGGDGEGRGEGVGGGSAHGGTVVWRSEMP